MKRYLHEAQLPAGKRLSHFDFSAVHGIKANQVKALVEQPQWVKQAHNLLLFGPSGIGKTHLMPRQLLCPVGDNYLVRLVVVESGLVLPPVHGRLSAVTLPLAFQNGGMVDEPINGGDGHHVVLKYLPPFAEGMVGGDDE